MKRSRYEIWKKEEYSYPRAGEFIPNIVAFLHEDEEIRPAMIIAPGGAYAILCPSEADYQARKFYEKGYNTFVLSYTNNVTLDTPLELQPLRDISRTVKFIRKNKEMFYIDPNCVIACGFSAGGHLVGRLAVHHKKPELNTDDGYKDISNRLDAAILNYPLVSLEELSVSAIIAALHYGDASVEEINDMSLELHVTRDTSPMFMLHGMADSIVSAKHSIILAEACLALGVDCEVHLLQNGEHGVSNEGVTQEDMMSSLYVYDQLYEAVKAMPVNEFQEYSALFGRLDKDMTYEQFMQTVLQETMVRIYASALRIDLAAMEKIEDTPVKKNPSVQLWTEMADNWIKLVVK